MKKYVLFIAMAFLFACGSQPTVQEKSGPDKVVVVSVNYPLHYFAQRIAGDFIQLKYPIPADMDPAYWVPDEKSLEIYQLADIILANGAGYAKWMNNVTLPSRRIVNTTASFEDKYLELKEVATHSHGPDGEHEHAGYAFTTWLDFELAAGQAESIKEILVNKLPEHKEVIEQNFNSLRDDLALLHERMKQIAIAVDRQNIMASHPIYQYLSQAYGLQIQSVHFEPDEMPSRDQWDELDHLLDHNPSVVMLWEGEPLKEIAELLHEKGIKVVVYNPCANQPRSGDFMDVMNSNISALQSIQ
jgi:zinc transport system substrate-binding protein